MDAPKHTPGPWVIYPETDGSEICAVDMAKGLPIRQRIASPFRGPDWIANARLIAAAPDLLAEHTEACDAADEILVRITAEIGRALHEEPDEDAVKLLAGYGVEIPCKMFRRLYEATSRQAILKAKGETA